MSSWKSPRERVRENSTSDVSYLAGGLPEDLRLGKDSGTTLAVFPYSEASGGVQVEVAPMDKTAFQHALAARRAELEGMHIDLHPEWPYLGESVPLPGGDGVVFNRSENGGSRGARTLELHGWKNGYAIEMTINANDVSYPEYRDDKQLQELGSTIEPKLAILLSLYARTRGRRGDELPSGPGACFRNGFLSGSASDKIREDITLEFVSKSMPNMQLVVSTDSGIGSQNTLLDRVPDLKRVLDSTKGQFIKKGSGKAKSGLAFEEVLTRTPTPDKLPPNLWFALEANSERGDTVDPLLDIHLERSVVKLDDTGEPVSHDELVAATQSKFGALTEAESVALWDKIVVTLRKRPGAF